MARCQFLGEAPLTGDVYAAISSRVIADTELATELLSDLDWDEYDGTYTRQQVVIIDVTPGEAWRLRAESVDFGTPGTPSAPGVAVVLYQGTSDLPANDATAHVLGWIQGDDIPFLPFTGDGAIPFVINWPGGGTVLQGPNC